MGGWWSGPLRQAAWINVGGARLVGGFNFSGGQISQRSVIPCCINAEDFARGARFNNNFQCLCE